MRLSAFPFAVAVALGGVPLREAAAQVPRPRTADYLTVAGPDDVRAAWVNPAGLARVLEASVMAEGVVDRPPGEGVALSQYTLGLNSRGFAITYARDRTVGTAAVGLTRFALALPFAGGSVGAAFTMFRGGGSPPAQGWDVGLAYRPSRSLDLGASVRHINRPIVRQVQLPVTALVGARWFPVPGYLSLEGEAGASDSGPGGFTDLRYRAMVRLSVGGGRRRFHFLSGADFMDQKVERWIVGLALGGADWLGVLGGGSRAADLDRPDRFSLTAVASRRAPGAVR